MHQPRWPWHLRVEAPRLKSVTHQLISMRPELVPLLADVLREYVSTEELQATGELFGVECPFGMTGQPSHFDLARMLVTEELDEPRWRLLSTLLEMLDRRCDDAVVHNTWERQSYHAGLQSKIGALREEILAGNAPREIAVEEGKPFTARAELRSLTESATGTITLIDNYVGARTLDCLRDARDEIRLLTGAHNQALAADFDRALADFKTEGFRITVRRHPNLHDRYLAFDGRVWLIGGSLKDAGKKSLSVVECVDSAAVILADIEEKWQNAAAYP